jgi:hypothetical protein
MNDYYLKGQEAGYRDGQMYADCEDRQAYPEFQKGYLSGYREVWEELEAQAAAPITNWDEE